jgi:bifunctional oligoribonuclease and PAP phosphatase NrnA
VNNVSTDRLLENSSDPFFTRSPTLNEPEPAGAIHADSPIDWARFGELVRANASFALTTHVRPDCDALGSVLAMAVVLERLGKKVLVVAGYAMPPNLRWMDPQRRIKQLGVDASPAEVEACDVLMVLDTSAWAQLNHVEKVIRAFPGKRIVVDHHVSSDEMGAEVFKNPQAEATGRLVVEAADQLGVAITPELAAPLFAALATDTGWFRFSSVTPETYRLAARLAAAGASPAAIYRELYENESLARLHLIGRVMARTETDLDGRLIYTWVTLDDYAAAGALPTDTEDVINMTLLVGGTQAAVILAEQPDGRWKVSFRSRGQMDCSRVAEQFGGGGHKAAAGAMVAGVLDAARARVLDAVRHAMR